MRIACPSCAVAYEVPDSLLKPGRTARCAQCGHKWAPLPLEDPASPAHAGPPLTDPDERDAGLRPPDRPHLSAMDLLAAHRRRQQGSRFLRVAWIASSVVLVALVAAFIVWRNAVAEAWPPSARLYHMLRLGVPADAAPASAPPPAVAVPPAPAKPH